MIDLSRVGQGKAAKTLPSEDVIKPSLIFSADIETHGKDGKVGECASSSSHGIAGISLCNMAGQTTYLVIDDGREYGGIPIDQAIEYLNDKWFVSGSTAVFHNGKFDLGFLLGRGLSIEGVSIRDTWIIASLLRRGVYVSNALKEIVKEVFGIDTDSQDVIKKWLVDNKTEDYGDIPVELIGPYACDDVIYTLALFFHQKPTEQDLVLHALYLRNALHLIEAEALGICLDLNLIRERNDKSVEKILQYKNEMREIVGSAKVDFEDDQSIMRYMHNKSLHSGPRTFMGENKFIADTIFLKGSAHPMAKAFLMYHNFKSFLTAFSGTHGTIGDRIWKDGATVGISTEMYMSIFSRGGIVLSRTPNFTSGVSLRADCRELFVPRPEYDFLTLKANNIYSSLLGYYTSNKNLEVGADTKTKALCEYYGKLMKGDERQGSIAFKRIVDGFGWKVLDTYLRVAECKVKNPRACSMEFDTALPGYHKFLERLSNNLLADGHVTDRAKRVIKIPEDKLWRRGAILLQSSFGSLCAQYLDLFCRLAEKTGARLVLAHEDEFVFEVPKNSVEFSAAIFEVNARPITEPCCHWHTETVPARWVQKKCNAEAFVTKNWI